MGRSNGPCNIWEFLHKLLKFEKLAHIAWGGLLTIAVLVKADLHRGRCILGYNIGHRSFCERYESAEQSTISEEISIGKAMSCVRLSVNTQKLDIFTIITRMPNLK